MQQPKTKSSASFWQRILQFFRSLFGGKKESVTTDPIIEVPSRDHNSGTTGSGTTGSGTTGSGTTEASEEMGGIFSRGINPPPNSQGGSKPFDDIIRREKDAASTNIFALVAGINAYESPNSVSELRGCIKDVDSVVSYLQKKYPAERLHLRILKDDQATYENIKDGFVNHLGQASGADTIFFHFSGHGAQVHTAQEFMARRADAEGNLTIPAIEPNGLDQCLVCFQKKATGDQPAEGRLFLHDKELAKLIDDASTKNSVPNNRPHVVISLDTCHSGGGTKGDEGAKPRFFAAPASQPREIALRNGGLFAPLPLSEYYGGYTPQNLEIPKPRHVLLSAALSHELANDIPAVGGVFTLSLVEALNEAHDKGETMDYNRLFNAIRRKSRKLQDELKLQVRQNPQIENHNGFDPYSAFLDGFPAGKPGVYEVKKDGNSWIVECGAIHGLPVLDEQGGEEQKIKVIIYEATQAERGLFPAAFGYVKTISAQFSTLELRDASGNITPEPDSILDIGKEYYGVIGAMPAKEFFIAVRGNNTQLMRRILDAPEWEKLRAKNIFIGNGMENDPFDIEIIVEADSLELRKLGEGSNNPPMVSYKFSTVLTEDRVFKALFEHVLEHVADWQRFLELEHPKSRIDHMYKAELKIQGVEKLAEGETRQTHSFGPGEIILSTGKEFEVDGADTDSKADFMLRYNLQVDLPTVPQKLYFTLFVLGYNGEIKLADERKTGNLPADKSDEAFSMLMAGDNKWRKMGLWRMGMADLPGDFSATYWFKLIATTEPLNTHLLLKKPLSPGGDRPFDDDEDIVDVIKRAWAVSTFQLTFTREQFDSPQFTPHPDASNLQLVADSAN